MDNLIEENKNLVYYLANHFGTYHDKEDLFQVGYIGLIKASKNYKDDMETKFSTYAYMYVLGEIKKYLREDRPYKVSRDLVKLNLKIEKANIYLTQKIGRVPTSLELSEYLDIPYEIVSSAINSNAPVISMDASYTEEKDTSLYDIIEDKQVDIDMLLMLKDAINELREPERSIICKRYMEDLTQTEVADSLGMSQVQVSRNENKVLKRLRTKLHN